MKEQFSRIITYKINQNDPNRILEGRSKPKKSNYQSKTMMKDTSDTF